MVDIIVWIIFGALAGWIASMIMNTDREQGAVTNVLVGIGGAVLGGFIARNLGGSGVTGFNLWSLAIAIGGAMILIAMFKAFSRR